MHIQSIQQSCRHSTTTVMLYAGIFSPPFRDIALQDNRFLLFQKIQYHNPSWLLQALSSCFLPSLQRQLNAKGKHQPLELYYFCKVDYRLFGCRNVSQLLKNQQKNCNFHLTQQMCTVALKYMHASFRSMLARMRLVCLSN